jgi:hypothetical protein
MNECTNPTRPCKVHDEQSEWHIEIRHRTYHSVWFIIALALVIAASTLPGLN